MTIEVPLIPLGISIFGATSLIVAYYLGKSAKLRELHRLQDEGLLEVKYLARSKRSEPSKEWLMNAIHAEEGADIHAGAPDLDIVAYPRRDSEERREDVAINMKRRLDHVSARRLPKESSDE